MREELVKAQSFQFWTGAIVVPALLALAGIAVPLVCFRNPDLPEISRIQLAREFRQAIDAHWGDPSRQRAALDEIASRFIEEQGTNFRGAVAELREQTATRLMLSFESLERGKQLVTVGRFGDALAEFRSASALDPENPIAWSNLGAAATLVRDFQLARESYDRARYLAPTNSIILYNFGLLLAEQGELAAARQHIGRAIREAPLDTRQSLLADLRANPSFNKLKDDSDLRALLNEVLK